MQTHRDDVSDVGDLADLLQGLLRAGGVEVKAAHRDTAGANTPKGEGRDVDLHPAGKTTKVKIRRRRISKGAGRGGGGRKQLQHADYCCSSYQVKIRTKPHSVVTTVLLLCDIYESRP